VIITFTQSGGDVVETGSGTFNLTDLTLATSGSAIGAVIPNESYAIVGVEGPVSAYTGFSGPSNFGSGGEFGASSNTGSVFGIYGGTYIIVPSGYTSGDPLSGTTKFNGQTFAAMGMNPGTYTWTWGTGANADFLTIQIGSVPEPSTFVLAGIAGVVGLGMWARRRIVQSASRLR
jgi:PEP-CTERM motif